MLQFPEKLYPLLPYIRPPLQAKKEINSLFPTELLRPDKSGLAITQQDRLPAKHFQKSGVCIINKLRLKYWMPCV